MASAVHPLLPNGHASPEERWCALHVAAKFSASKTARAHSLLVSRRSGKGRGEGGVEEADVMA